jgi:putative ABC transport system permease protein
MLQNYFKIAWRNLVKDRQFTFLNVLGLSAGLACTLLIYLWVHDEMSYDKFFGKGAQIYQLMEQRKGASGVSVSDESSGLLGEVVAAQDPEVVYASPLAPPDWFQKFTLSAGDKNLKAIGQYAGKDYFNIFSFKLLSGQKDKVLANKDNIVISDELATKLYGTTENIIGKPVRFQRDKIFFISGVFEKTPVHSSQQFDFVLSFDYLKDTQGWVATWNNTGPHNFIMLKEGTDVNAFNKRIAGVVTQGGGDTTRIPFATKFSDNYLLNTFSHGSKTGSKIEYVRLFSLIAIFILLIACINFMNLSTAKASRRMKEVGVKKVLGARRRQLIIQFLSESILVAALSMIIATGLAWLLLPPFNNLTGKEIHFSFSPSLILALVAITIFTGLVSGSYPALYLSKFNPLMVLKGKINSSFAELISRRGLVIFQFTLSIMLIVSVLVIYKQVQFIQSLDPGYNKDNIVRFDSEGKIQNTEETFIDEVKKIPGVVDAAFTFNNMVGRNYGTNGIDWPGKNPNENDYFEGFGGGFDFIETMGMHVISGRGFSKNFGNEDAKIILNEAAVRLMQLKDPVGKNIRLFDSTKQVIGVVKDFHFESLHEPVKPAYIALQHQGNNPWYKIMVRIQGGHQRETIERLQQFYEAYNPGFPFSFNFLDAAYKQQYDTEVRVAKLSRYFSSLAILISCLGLFGLVAFTAQKRQREIGIRKVIGASVSNIIFMMSKDFLKLVIIAIVIAFPVSWWAMHSWLESFAYRINIGAVVFLIAAASIICITMVTISLQAIKAAVANPVKSLRSE